MGIPICSLTFTCNPKWEEIQDTVMSQGSQDASVRPDIIARVFKIKLDMLLADLTKKDVLGRVRAGISFQQSNSLKIFILLQHHLCLPNKVNNVLYM